MMELPRKPPTPLLHGLCECGCGQKAPIAKWSNATYSWTAGQPKRFIWGHNPTRGGFKHGHGSIFRRNPTYVSWLAMKARCQYPKHPAYERYRHLPICERWNLFENFLADMGERPAGRTLGRIDNEKGYSKENCQWETRKEQAANKRRPRADSLSKMGRW